MPRDRDFALCFGREIVRQSSRELAGRRMHIITVASQKGGVGKTTMSLNLGLALARAGNRTLLMELDAQGSLWQGHARLVLSAGAGSRDAIALPGQVHWSLRPHGLGRG